jgi:hypothetical protein
MSAASGISEGPAIIAYNFGVGNWFCKRTDTTYLLGVLQDLEIDIDRTLKELIGQFALPVDVAQAQMKITGKGKYASVSTNNINNTILGQTLTTASGFMIAAPEAQTPGATTFTVTNGATFSEDLGVRYHASNTALTPTSATPGTGYYIPGAAATGKYTIAAADEVALDVYYSYTVTTLNQISAVNQFMGTGTTFELIGSNTYNVCGTQKMISIKLNQCKASKTGMPFKNVDYLLFDTRVSSIRKHSHGRALAADFRIPSVRGQRSGSRAPDQIWAHH